MRLHTSLLLGAALLTTAACGKKNEAPQADTTAVAPAPPAPLTIANVDLGKAVDAEGRVATPMMSFGTRDTIYASVTTTGVGDSANLISKWSLVKGDQTLAPVGEMSMKIGGTASVSHVHVVPQKPWEKGNYRVEIVLNDGVPVVRDFTVQ